MDSEVKNSPAAVVSGDISREPEIGAYSAKTGSSFARDITRKLPYAYLEKTGAIDPSSREHDAAFQKMMGKITGGVPKTPTEAVMDSNNRWLKELGATSADINDFQKAWETDSTKRRKSEHEWRDSYGGKLAIRTFSRGVLGSVFFATGQHMVGKYLKNYSFDHSNPNLASEIHNPLEAIARIFDKTLGQGIYKVVLKVTKDEKTALNAVTFRHTNAWAGYSYGNYIDAYGNKQQKKGRSYGHEALAITADFGVASWGDALGRQIAGLVDPNTEKKWMKDGHIDVPEALKATLKAIWINTTKAMGEDYFAMAAGYPYIVRGTRNLIDKFSPGFKYDSDHWANGGSVKVDDNKKVVGNYQLEGMTDLGLRFTAYNMLTKMYRDGYDKVASAWHKFWNGDRTIHMPRFENPPTPTNLLKSAIDGIKKSVNYVVRTVIKEAIIMIPSSSVFAFIRAAQSKDIGLAIHPEKGPVGMVRDDGYFANHYATGSFKSADGRRSEIPVDNKTQFYFQNEQGIRVPAPGSPFISDKSQGYERRPDAYGRDLGQWHDKPTNIVGRFCNESGHSLAEIAKPVVRTFSSSAKAGDISKHCQRYMDATLAYTPYFMVKTDLLSTAYDTPRMDMAIDRMIGGIGHLNFGEFKAGSSEVVHTILNRPMLDPDREKLAQKRMRTYSNQLWSSQDEILAKEKEEEYQERMDAQLSLGKPIAMHELYRRPFTERVGRREASANDLYYAQNITPITPKKPEDYKRQEEWKMQANGSWHDKAIKEYQDATTSRGQTIN